MLDSRLLLLSILVLVPSCRPSLPSPISVEVNLAYSSEEDPVSEQGCTRCETVGFVNAWGSPLTVIVDFEHGFSLAREEIESVTLVELPGVEDPARGGWLVTADLTTGGRRKSDSHAAAHPHSLVFVRTNGVPTSAHALDDWDLGLMLAEFRQRQEAEEFAEKLDLPIVVEPAKPAEIEAIRRDLRALEEESDEP